MNKSEGGRPSVISKLRESLQSSGDTRLVAKLDKVIKKAQPNPPEDQLPKLRRYMIDTSKMPEFVRRRRHKRLERYESRKEEKQPK